MATIREIAEYTNLSPSTVSIVLNGKSKSRNISEATAKKIFEAAKELGYTPNIPARRLRNNSTKKYVAVFWANDYRAPLLFEFINGMQKFIEESKDDIEIILRLFNPDHLSKAADPDQLTMYSATVICTASKIDLDYLEKTDFSTPIVLYNRSSQKYSNVLLANEDIGAKAAEIFSSHGKKRAIIFSANNNHSYYNEKRLSGFINFFNSTGGITTIINSNNNSLESARNTIADMESSFADADCVFCLEVLLAISYVNYLRDKKLVDVPSSQEIITIGVHDNTIYESLHIPLSVIEIPIETMGTECMRIVTNKLNGNYFQVESKKVTDFIYNPRLSCI
ncbi:MAG TPA: LacI family transcriptional regulator [Clostridiales bacterium]|nr:LacI family transcriptional regulator [Clostridiales bacterium]